MCNAAIYTRHILHKKHIDIIWICGGVNTLAIAYTKIRMHSQIQSHRRTYTHVHIHLNTCTQSPRARSKRIPCLTILRLRFPKGIFLACCYHAQTITIFIHIHLYRYVCILWCRVCMCLWCERKRGFHDNIAVVVREGDYDCRRTFAFMFPLRFSQ